MAFTLRGLGSAPPLPRLSGGHVTTRQASLHAADRWSTATSGFDPDRFPSEPPICYRASWQLPGPDLHRLATATQVIPHRPSTSGRTPARWCHDAPQRTILTALDGERASGSWCAAGAPNRPRATSSARSTPFPCSISSTRSPSSTRVSVTRPPVRGRVRITAARKHQRPVGQGAPVVDVADVVEVRRYGHRFLVDADARRARHRLRVSDQPMNTQLSVVADALMLADVKHV